MIIHRVSIIGEMQRGCMETAALVLDQKTFSFHRKLNLNFMQKNFFYQSCVCKVVEPMFETGFWPFYWVSSGGWWLYRLMYPHRFSGSKRKYLNWLLVLNMLGFVKFWHFFLWWLRPQLHSTLRRLLHKMDSWCESAKVPTILQILLYNVKHGLHVCRNVILWRLVSAWEGPRHHRCDVSIEPRWGHCVDKPDTSP